MFNQGGVLEGPEDRNGATRIEPQKCGSCVRPSLLRPKLASGTA